jgi:tetratricopeptide (TPR) repeat protein
MTERDDARAWALIQELQSIEGQEARREALTWSLLESFPEDLREATVAAAIPHWFDAQILSALLPDRADEAEALYRELQRQHFVEPYAGRGQTLHELTRQAILARLWRNDPDHYRALSERAWRFFSDQAERRPVPSTMSRVLGKLSSRFATPTEPDPATDIEALYHWLAADEEAALDALTGLHDRFRNVGARYHLAEALLRAAAEQAEGERLSRRGQLYVRLEQAVLAVQRYKWEQATAWLQAVLAGTDDRWLRARATRYLGDVHVMLDEYEAARARYEEALPIYQAIGARLGEANTIRSLGDVHVMLDEYEAARARYEEALPIYQAIGSRLGEANTIRSLGDVHVRLSEYEAARARYEEALPIYRAIGARLGEANTISSLGDVHVMLAEYEAARARYEEALPIYQAIGDRLGEANTISSLGDVHVRLAEYEAARARYEEALPIYQAIGSRLGEADTIKSLGDLDVEIERYTEAEAWYAKAEAIYQAIETPANVASVLSSKANAFDQMGDYRRAVETYTQAIALRSNFARWYHNRSSIHLEWGDTKAARADLERAAELQPDHPYLAVRRADLALVEGDDELALRYCEEAHKQLPGISDPYFTKGLALLRLRRLTEARIAFEQGMERASRSDLSSAIRWVERHGPGGATQAEILNMLQEAVEAKRARYA